MELHPPPGYRVVVPLDRHRHRGLGVHPRARGFGGNLNAIYLTAAEFFRAVHYYPIVFGRDPGLDQYVPVALTGLKPGTNLFASGEGGWREGAYVPAYVRRYPFCSAEIADAGSGPNRLICVEEMGLSADAPALFGEDGEPTEAWRGIERLINEMDTAHAATVHLVEQIAALDLLEPFEAQAHPKGGEAFKLAGLFRVNESRLNRAPGRSVKALMESGALSRIYAHLISLDNFAILLDLYATPPDGGPP